jgi:hypothetical protein
MAEDGVDSDQHQQQPPEGRGGETVKLFVGQVPKQMTEAELAAMFSGVALVDEVTVIRDRGTRVSRGPDPYAFIPPSSLPLPLPLSLSSNSLCAPAKFPRPPG